MNTTDTHNQRIAKMTFASVYPLYIAKVERKGRTKEELHQVIEWLTGFDDKKLEELIKEREMCMDIPIHSLRSYIRVTENINRQN